MQVVKRTDSLKRISFLAHSLSGLFARYAIFVLYSLAASSTDECNEVPASTNSNSETASLRRGLVAGLEPVNFITLATPHLGGRTEGKNLREGTDRTITALAFMPASTSFAAYSVRGADSTLEMALVIYLSDEYLINYEAERRYCQFEDKFDLQGDPIDVAKVVAKQCGRRLSNHNFVLHKKYKKLKETRGEEYAETTHQLVSI